MDILTPCNLQQAKDALSHTSIDIVSDIWETCLHVQEDPEVIKYLLDQGADPNAKTMTGNTPLHYKKCPEAVDLLLKSGANPNAINSYGNTPLHKQTDKRSVQLLLESGADRYAKNEIGYIPRQVNKNVSRFTPFQQYVIGFLFLSLLVILWVLFR